jgi:sortase (surface protein transpeptidase)
VGLDGNGNMGVPVYSSDVAWFNQMPRPGDKGDAVITGHVNWWDTTCAVFCNLQSVQIGMLAYVDRQDGSTIRFVVDAYNYYPANAPPDWLYTTSGAPQLSLITCGGDFDAASGHYLKRLVVHTTLG